MSVLKELAVDHDYYCSESNYYSNDAAMRYETMTDFLDEFERMDVDLNLCFRWDIKESEEEPGKFSAEVFLMLQRKGIFKPVEIESVSEEEAERFKAYAERHWEKLKSIWEPIS